MIRKAYSLVVIRDIVYELKSIFPWPFPDRFLYNCPLFVPVFGLEIPLNSNEE